MMRAEPGEEGGGVVVVVVVVGYKYEQFASGVQN